MQTLPNWGKGNRMALDVGFVAAVLEGIEGTLEEVIERVETSELRASLDVLQSRVTALRASIEPGRHRAEIERCEEPVVVER
jgi:hypothetical protein